MGDPFDENLDLNGLLDCWIALERIDVKMTFFEDPKLILLSWNSLDPRTVYFSGFRIEPSNFIEKSISSPKSWTVTQYSNIMIFQVLYGLDLSHPREQDWPKRRSCIHVLEIME